MSTSAGQFGTSSRRRLTELLDPEFMARLDSLDLFSRKILQGKLQGERRSKRRGQSVEFADHRPYVAGDDLRFVDWNIYGRLDQLFLKLFVEEQDLTVHVVFDTSASVGLGDPPKERAIKRLAAALAYVGLVNNSRVTVSAFADGLVGQIANMRGRSYLGRLAEFLLSPETSPAGPSRFDEACKQIMANRIGVGVMIVLSDFLFKEGFEGGIRRLMGGRYDLYAIQVLSPDELSPKLGGDLKLLDVEDGDVAEVTISPALVKFYERNVAAYCNELRALCARGGASHVLTSSADRPEPLVLTYLRRIGMLR